MAHASVAVAYRSNQFFVPSDIVARGSCLPRNGTYTGDPPSGLTNRGTFLGWKSNQEVRCAVESGIRVFGRS